jgi:hypothetical protein
MAEPNIAPDVARFVAHLDDAEVIFLTTVIGFGPSGVEEMYIHLAERYNNMPDRHVKATQATERFFSEEAYDRYEKAQREVMGGGQQLFGPDNEPLPPLGGPNNPHTS